MLSFCSEAYKGVFNVLSEVFSSYEKNWISFPLTSWYKKSCNQLFTNLFTKANGK